MSARTSKPGVSITPEDLAALDAKRLTLQDLADRERCSKQNISKRIRTIRPASSTGPSAPSGAAAFPAAPTGPSIPADAVLINAAEIATSACLGLLHRAHIALIGPDQIGPSGLKALAATISTATAELRQLGVLTSDDAEVPTELIVRVLSDSEHEALKRTAEQSDD